MLLALVTGQRGQSLHTLTLDDLKFSVNGLTLVFNVLLKTSKPGNHQKPVMLEYFKDDSRICVIQTLKTYLVSTAPLRGKETALLISTVAPHQKICRATLARWIKTVLSNSGIDTTQF